MLNKLIVNVFNIKIVIIQCAWLTTRGRSFLTFKLSIYFMTYLMSIGLD